MREVIFMMRKIEELLKDRGLLESMGITCDISVNEIKKGKVNHIFKLTDINKNLSYILKKSETKLAGLNMPIVSGFNISVLRNHNEANVLQYIANNISETYVPRVVMTSKEDAFFVMEFLEDYEDVRDVFLKMKIPTNFAKSLSNILADIYLKTLDVTEETIGIENRCMLDVIMMLLVKVPYEVSMVKANKALVDVDFFVESLEKKELIPSVMELAYKLKSCKQALLNGDLHLGSIFYKESNYRIYDYEFAFKGPVGYEIGKIIAHMILAYYYVCSLENGIIAEGILEQLVEFFDEIIGKLEKNDAFSNSPIKEDTIRFCGLELISRVTGILQLKYITEIKDTTIKDKMQKKIFKIGSEMIKGKVKIATGKELADYVSG